MDKETRLVDERRASIQDHEILGDKFNTSHEEATHLGELTPEELVLEKQLRVGATMLLERKRGLVNYTAAGTCADLFLRGRLTLRLCLWVSQDLGCYIWCAWQTCILCTDIGSGVGLLDELHRQVSPPQPRY